MGILRTTQSNVKTRLDEHTYFDDITVLIEDTADIENEINRALSVLNDADDKIGLCIIVMTPFADAGKPNLPGPYFGEIEIYVRILENVMFNRGATGTGKYASDAAEVVAWRVHHYQPDGGHMIYAQKPTIRIVEPPEEGMVAYDVAFKTSGQAVAPS